jgi:hypothetical protein
VSFGDREDKTSDLSDLQEQIAALQSKVAKLTNDKAGQGKGILAQAQDEGSPRAKQNDRNETTSNHTKDNHEKGSSGGSRAPVILHNDTKNTTERSDQPPIWSAAATFAMRGEGHDSRSIENARDDANIKFRLPGRGRRLRTMRRAMELLTYGLGGILPYFGKILPAINYEGATFRNTTDIRVAVIPDAALIVLDLIECDKGRKTKEGNVVKDGLYNVCFYGEHYCFLKKIKGQNHLSYERRIHDPPSPGHEIWSCTDHVVTEQLAAAQALDFLIYHTDRFYKDRGTNNVFFLEHQRPIQFVSIDHDRTNNQDIFRYKSYKEWVRLKLLLGFDLPQELRSDLQRVRLLGSQGDFVRNLNASIDGQLDSLVGMLDDLWHGTDVRFKKGWVKTPPNATSLTDILWRRFEELVNFYNITIGD